MTPNQSRRCSRLEIEPSGLAEGSSLPIRPDMAVSAWRGFMPAIGTAALITLVAASLSLPATARAAAVPLAPTGITQTADPEFRWTADRNASNYLLELHAATGGIVDKAWLRSREIECATGGTCVYDGLSVPLGAFRYRVRSFFGSTKGDWSPFLDFERSVETATADPLPDNEIEPGAGIEDGEAPTSSPTTSLDVPAIPAPAANLVIHYLQPSGFQKVTGRADQDLLLVSPNQSINGKFQIVVDGFRGVYWIGASFDPQSAGWLTSPNGRRTEGVGTLIRIQTHKDAVRPFIVLGRMHLKTSNIQFGDFAQLGGDTTVGKWQAYPDVWRCRMIAEPLYGWRDYNGGSFSRYVSHSDFTKFETGGVRHSYAARIDATWGYQGEYVLPSYASDKKPYRGPDGRGTAQYWDYVARAVTNSSIGSESKPKAFFLARGSDEVAAGDHITYHFSTSGRGVWVVPAGSRPATDHIHPGGGTYAPQVSGSTLTWRSPSGDPFVVGRINDGSKASPPSVVSAGEIGHAQRVTDRAALERAIAGLCR